MDLKNNKITVGELLDNPKAKELLMRDFPILNNEYLIKMARGMSLENTLELAKGLCDKDLIKKTVCDLEAI